MNILKIRNIFPNQQFSRYNLSAWQKPDSDSIFFIGREVMEPGALGEPDTGILKYFEVNANHEVVHERVIWKPVFEGINLEDPRALQLDDDSLNIGLTAVLRDRKGVPIPFPAIIAIDAHNSWRQELPPFLVISSFGPGKNVTPIDNHTYLFRPETMDYHHQLLVFSLHKQIPEKIGDIQFPLDLEWGLWRMGTTMPPIWINDNEALFIIHGITIERIAGQDKYIYSLGRAKLTRKDATYTVQVAPEPILTPDDFLTPEGQPLVNELHPELRRVVYSCGGVIKKENTEVLSLYVNVGDRTTFEVQLSMDELKRGLF